MCSSHNQPSFFKVLVGDFSTQLLIPVEFSRKYEEMMRGKYHLQTEHNKSWTVKISEMNEKKYMKKGWSEFVRGNQLEEGDYLVFDYVGKSTFKVAVFAKSGVQVFPNRRLSIKYPIK